MRCPWRQTNSIFELDILVVARALPAGNEERRMMMNDELDYGSTEATRGSRPTFSGTFSSRPSRSWRDIPECFSSTSVHGRVNVKLPEKTHGHAYN
jgi:hypothetical protein